VNTCILQLGRFGDIINILPLVYATGWPIVVAEEFASLAQSIDYAQVIPAPVPAVDFPAGWRFAQRQFVQICATQVYNHTPPDFSLPHGFMEQSYRNAGRHAEFLAGRYDVIPAFKRDEKAEARLRASVLASCRPPARPILVCTSGVSSPFRDAALVLATVKRYALGRPVVDISGVRAEKFVDMLGLLDAAALLVTVDCGMLHLAGAHGKVPYIAYRNNLPGNWYRGYCRGNCVAKCDYSNVQGELYHLPRIISSLR
jgi:hypothetical protein